MVWALVAWVIPSLSAQAFPIPPETLWSLTFEAEWVVWADVEAVRTLTIEEAIQANQEDGESGAVARLRVREAWKGQAREGEELEVHYEHNLICPAPAHFEQGLAVVAFLVHRAGKWRPVALSYGTRYPASNDDAEAYRRAVTLARGAQDRWTQARIVGRRLDLEAARVDWQVRVAAHPATRWDGLYGLVPDADRAHSIYDWRKRNPARLTGAQREQLAHSFVERPPVDPSLPMMLMMLRGHADPRVDLAAARALETVARHEEYRDWVSQSFDLLRARHGEDLQAHQPPTPEELRDRLRLDGLRTLSTLDAKRVESFAKEWASFKQRHRLKPALLPLPVEPPVPGTGGDTPL
ncbi:hypothetical protein NVS55_31625 [Myxococcus stipitatus]|uniref:hypothetical protein n=1 Tax=Myxococcus stipitatus TaxID=83455 RepID=UPI0031453283